MTQFKDYLKEVKTRLDCKSDGELSRKLKLTSASTHHLIHGITVASDETCLRIAELTGDNPAYIIALAHASKATDKTRPVWEKIAALTTSSLITLLVLFISSRVFCILC